MPEADTAVDLTARPSTTPQHAGDDGRPVATADVGAERVRSGFHPEIQGLRAVAVLLVVLFHLWPNALSGGFVGVDVFFVISGYLITAHLYREVAATGTVSLRRFWARRIRRLLPASLLVLAISGLATVLFLPATVWTQTARQIAASALYVQNWALAADSVDYMAKDDVPTLAQHYWSLSVEEQFYAFWPILIVGLVAWAGRFASRRAAANRAVLIVGLGAVGVISLAWSVVATADNQSTAYFATPTRVWEFVAGALVTLVVVSRKLFGPASQRRWMARAGRHRHGRLAVRRSEPLSRMDRSSAGGRDCRRDRGWDDQVAICAGAMAVDSAHDLCRRHLLFRLSLALAADHRRPLCHRR